MASLEDDLRAGLDPSQLLHAWGLEPEDWQNELLRLRPQRALLCCCRQAGKSTTAAAAACHEALYAPGSLILMLAPAQRQSSELLLKARSLLVVAAPSIDLKSDSSHTLELANGSRVISLPGKEETTRGFSKVSLLIIDEAAWVADELYFAVRPMISAGGRLLALSTPNGQRGWFHREWTSGKGWHQTTLTAAACPRISSEFLAEERRTMTAAKFASEYECEFTDAIDSVFSFADVRAAINPDLTPLYPGGW